MFVYHRKILCIGCASITASFTHKNVIELYTHLDGVSFAYDSDVALQVALGSAIDVVRVREHGPFVIELMVCNYPQRQLDLLPSTVISRQGCYYGPSPLTPQ